MRPISNANSHPAETEKRTDTTAGSEIGTKSIRPVDLRAHLEFLADDLLEGRDTGSRGARIAANYIATHFERLGLQPVGEGQSYFQPVELISKNVAQSSEFKIEINDEMVPLVYGEDFIVIRSPATGGELLELDAVFAGYGIQADEYNYDDYKGLNVESRAVVYVSGEPGSEDDTYFDGDKDTRHASGRTKRHLAKEAGAKVVIGVMRDEQLGNFPWATLKGFLARPQTRLASSKLASDDILALLVHPQAAKLIFAEEKQSYDAVDKDASAGTVKPFQMRKKIQTKIDFEIDGFNDNNVVGFLEGSDPQLKSEVIIFTAHYDHVGLGAPVAGDSIYNGAADNASGVAGLLEISEAFASLPTPPRRSLLFLAVTAEEKGLLGSRFYVENPIFPVEQTVANFNMDMIGIGDSTALVVYGIERSSLGENIRTAAEKIGLKIYPDDMPEERVFFRSDHYSFARVGIPAIFPSFGIKREGRAEFRKFYHKPSDEKNLKWFNYNYMQRHVQVVFLASLAVANTDEPPAWTPGDEFEKLRKPTMDQKSN